MDYEAIAIEICTSEDIEAVLRAHFPERPEAPKAARDLDKLISDIQSVEPGSGGVHDIDHDDAVALVERYVLKARAELAERKGDEMREALKRWTVFWNTFRFDSHGEITPGSFKTLKEAAELTCAALSQKE